MAVSVSVKVRLGWEAGVGDPEGGSTRAEPRGAEVDVRRVRCGLALTVDRRLG